jgi:hypothetical protein
MGTNILRISVIANRSNNNNNHSDNTDSSEKKSSSVRTNEFLLLETPSKAQLKERSPQFSFGQSIFSKAANIGKLAKLSERKIRDERPVFSMVSH